MTPVHASANTTPCTSAAAQGRPGPARGPAHEADASSPADLFAQLLADLQASAEVPSDPAACPSGTLAADSADDASETAPLAATAPSLTAPWGLVMANPVTAMDPNPTAAGDDRAGLATADVADRSAHIATDELAPGGTTARAATDDPALGGTTARAATDDLALGVASSADEQQGPFAPRAHGRPSADDAMPQAAAPRAEEAAQPTLPRGKGRDKGTRANPSLAAPATDAPRSEQAWVALRAAVPHAGPAHGLRALAAEAPTVPPTPTPSDGPTPATTGSSMDLGSSLASSSGGPQASGALALGHEGGATASSDAALPLAFAAHLHEALQQTLETVGTQVALWQAGRTQHASLTFEDGWDEPLAVDVSLDQGVAHLNFRTDDEAARRLIQAQAPQVLADALARAGLTLGQLDVGGRQSSSQESERPAPRTLRVAAGGDSRRGPLPTGPVHRPAPRLGGLDVYA